MSFPTINPNIYGYFSHRKYPMSRSFARFSGVGELHVVGQTHLAVQQTGANLGAAVVFENV